MARMIRQNPRAFETLTARIRELDGKQVKVGWFSSSVYPNGTPVALVAAVQELGSPAKNIPPRLGMRATAMRKWGEWKDLMLDGAKAILQGRRTADQVMDAMGAKAAGDIAKNIASVWEPPLKEATVKARARKLASGVITPSLQQTTRGEQPLDQQPNPHGRLDERSRSQYFAHGVSCDRHAKLRLLRFRRKNGPAERSVARHLCRACDLQGSIQPVPRELYQTYGLQFDQNYVTAYMPESATDVSRDTAGDQIVYAGGRFQAVQKVNWYGPDGWIALLFVQVLPPGYVVDNQLFALVIQLIQQGMNAILAANYNLLTTESGNVITTEGGVGIEADTVVIPVLQAYQPTMQGVNTAPALYIHKIGDQRIGSPRRKSKWTNSYSQLTTENGIGIETESGIGIGADGTNQATMVHTEVQRYATMFQISALATQDPTTPMQLTASDLVNFAAAVAQSEGLHSGNRSSRRL